MVISIQFESSAPSEYRSAGQQTIKLSGFVDDGFDNLAPKDVARFVLPVQMKQFLPLDDEEAFGSMLLSVHLRGLSRKEVEVEDDSGEGQLGTLRLADAPTASTTLPITMVAGGRPSFTNLPGRSSLPSTEFTFSLSVAEGLERLFRSWFEIPLSSTFDIEEEVIHQQELLSRTASSNTSTSFSSNVIKPTRPHTLFPSGSCALLEARIQCCQRKPTRATNSGMAPYAYGSPNSPDLPTLFEFFYTDLLLEVSFPSGMFLFFCHLICDTDLISLLFLKRSAS